MWHNCGHGGLKEMKGVSSVRNVLAAFALGLLAVLALTVSAGAQDYPPTTPPTTEALGPADLARGPAAPGPAAAPARGPMPRTGSDSLILAQVGVALVAAGGLAAYAARRRITNQRIAVRSTPQS
jgi:hypothetical protein